MTQAWDRQEGEGPKAFAAFCAYRDMGAGRTLGSVTAARKGQPRGGGRAPGRITGWSTKFRWSARANQYDEHLDSERVRATEELARESAGRWAQRSEDLRETVWRISERLLRQADTLSAFPVTQQSRSADGHTVVWEAIDPKAVRSAAVILEAAQRAALSAVQGVPADESAGSGLRPMTPEDEAELERKLAGFREKHMEAIRAMMEQNEKDGYNGPILAPPPRQLSIADVG